MATRSKFIEEYMNGNDMQKELIKTGLERELWNIAHKNNRIENDFNLKNEYEKMFNRVCRSSGKSDTVFGEIIRGLTKLLYREYNDGDDIDTGYYSGIWYGLRYELYCPFTYGDNAVEYWDYDFDVLNNFGYSYKNYADNIIVRRFGQTPVASLKQCTFQTIPAASAVARWQCGIDGPEGSASDRRIAPVGNDNHRHQFHTARYNHKPVG